MNELTQIRSMAEMIIEKVSVLEGANPEVKSKFKVGDRVRSISGPSYGAIGTVVTVIGNLYYCKFDHGVYHHGYNHEDGLILTKFDTEPKFKVGDRVRAVTAWGNYWKVGDTGTIIASDSPSLLFEVKFDHNVQFGFDNEYDFELINPGPKFKVGDCVRHTGVTVNNTGKVTGIHKLDGHYRYRYLVLLDNGEHTHIIEPQLALVEADRKWHSGPPPHVGWWNASYYDGHNRNMSWRWWNGEYWSHLVFPFDSIVMVGISSGEFDDYQDKIQWTDYWPENARVPRVNPEAK